MYSTTLQELANTYTNSSDSEEEEEEVWIRRVPFNEKPYFKMIPENFHCLEEATKEYYNYKPKMIPFLRKIVKGKELVDYHTNDPLPEKKPQEVGYLYSGASDLVIEDDLQSRVPIKLYGYHTYGGYYGFFRPDVIEVMWLILREIDKKDLDFAKKIYVTTEAYPSLNCGQCYDSAKDRHMAKTLVYLM